MKRHYTTPTMRAVTVRHTQMLCASPYDNVTSPLRTYDDDDEVIRSKNEIW